VLKRGKTTLRWQQFVSPPLNGNAAAPIRELYCHSTYRHTTKMEQMLESLLVEMRETRVLVMANQEAMELSRKDGGQSGKVRGQDEAYL
jgi:hypothetical protein